MCKVSEGIVREPLGAGDRDGTALGRTRRPQIMPSFVRLARHRGLSGFSEIDSREKSGENDYRRNRIRRGASR